MIASVAGPATTARRLTTEPAKSAPPQPFVQPIQSRTPAATAITAGGEVDARRDREPQRGARPGRPAPPRPSVGARVGSTTPVDTTVLPSRLEPRQKDTPPVPALLLGLDLPGTVTTDSHLPHLSVTLPFTWPGALSLKNQYRGLPP